MSTTLDSLAAELRSFVETECGRLHVPGAAVGVIHDGEEWYIGFGVTNVDAPAPVDDAPLFQIGSNTKTYTATAIMREVEAGRIDLDAPLQGYLPDFELADEGVAARVTMRHLLTHTGGWDGDWLLVHPQGGRNDDALACSVEAMSQVPLRTEPGSLFHYNNAGFSLAGRVLEVVRDQSYEQAMRELLFDPLGLQHSVFFADEAITYRAAAGHVVRDGRPEVARTWELHRCSFPAGAIACDIRDLLRWGRFQLDCGFAANGERLLTEASIDVLHSPQVEIGDGVEAVGLSWMLGRVDGARTVSHSGGTNGQVSLHTIYPEHDAAVGVVTNANVGGELAREVTRLVERRLLGLEHRDPEPIDAGEALDQYVGTYEREMVRLELEREGQRLRVHGTSLMRPQDGETPPPAPAVTIGLLQDPDAFIILEGGSVGGRGRFIRDAAGGIEWLRWGGRVHRRQ